MLNPVSQVTQDRIEKINRGSIADKESFTIVMDYPEGAITTDTIITWSYTYAYDILEEEWEGKQESYPEEGEYTVRLRVKNLNGVWSDWVEIVFYVFNKDEVIQVAAGSYHTIVLKTDGTVWSWGYNSYGQLGDGTTTDSSTPVQVEAGASSGTYLSNVKFVAAGSYHTIVLKNDGTVWSWGANGYGQLGDNSITERHTPIQVVGASGETPLSNIKSIAAGRYHTIVLKNDGTVWSWGYNGCGQLGDGETTSSSTPVQVVGVSSGTCISNVKAIAAGTYHTVALKNDGTVWSWGRNIYGQLGDDSTTDRKTPVQVEAGASSGTYLSNVKSIAAGTYHTVALKNDGTVWSWGYNYYGQLGDNSTTERHTPVQVVGASGETPLSNIKSIAAGTYHTVALKNDGTVWSWGYNYYGQLGDGETTDKHTPVQTIFPR